MLLQEKLTNLEAVRDVLKGLNEVSTDATIQPREVRDLNLNSMSIPSIGHIKFTDDAIDQLGHKIGVPHSTFGWLRENHPQQAQEVLEQRWAGFLNTPAAKKPMLIRARKVGDTQFARAVLSDRYGVIDSLDLVEAMLKALPAHLGAAKVGGMKSRVWLDFITGRLSVKGIVADDMGLGDHNDRHNWGFVTSNDECGAGSAELGLVFGRLFCTNQFAAMGLGSGNNRQVHKLGKLNRDSFASKVDGWISGSISNVSKSFAKYWELKDTKVVDPAEVLMRLGRLNGLAKTDLDRVVADILPTYTEKDGYTAYAVVNSLTQFARDLENRAKQDLWEAAAGKIVVARENSWR